MNGYETVSVPRCWGVDTNTKLTAASARALAAASYQQKQPDGTYIARPIRFVWRYVFFGRARPGDIDQTEARAICDAGLILLLIQHPRNPGWIASPDLGDSDGAWAVENALAAGYTPDACLGLDLEGVGNSGAPVRGHAERWITRVRGGGFRRTVYVGFQAGLSPDELYDLRDVFSYFSDAGPRSVTTRGFQCKQYPQTKIAGILVDPDEAMPDALGGTLSGMAEVKNDTVPDLNVETEDRAA